MALRPQFAMVPSDFNDFLFASVGEEAGGTLTVLSALARLGIDPWVEAARLADLSAEAATSALAAAIAVLPEGDWKVADSSSIAARLVNSLPHHDGAGRTSSSRKHGGSAHAKPAPLTWLLYIMIFAATLFIMMHQHTDRAPEAPPGTTASPQR
jgi:hypothetical protein